ncbi:MAG: DUF1573 domain-containing protein [Nitrospirae bacterium]|nr:DUF1573 domain-containing protein [Nitrospirota bacterium]
MKKRALICLLFILFFYLNNAHAAPSILFTEESHDFGEVKQGDPLEYEFRFKNVGDETLIIKKVTAS